jgi:hypothetical protein
MVNTLEIAIAVIAPVWLLLIAGICVLYFKISQEQLEIIRVKQRIAHTEEWIKRLTVSLSA